MEYTTLGTTGIEVSRLCLGCMSFGKQNRDEWMLDEEGGRELIERAIELGITFFDTANIYSQGESEEILGDVLSEYDRDRFTVGTKVRFEMGDNPQSAGLSRKTIEQELDNSLERLGMDTVDLYQIHRWDYDTPIEQTLRALDDAVRRGKVRHIGASSMWAHQFAEALQTSERLGLERFETMQNLYNLAYREEEREMLPLCQKEGIGVIPWSPVAAGYLARPYEQDDATDRGEHETSLGRPYREGGGETINERVQELAAEKDRSMAQIALAWHLHKETVTAPIVGTSSVDHLEDAVEALSIDLSDNELSYLEEPYEPVRISGHE
ncbi:aryl-alcohol dehydrogenase-like predicted oxidoreductase [Halohasta litchfieldiae]|jgi:aryl-alcohol dehydrogenase-like predicted oxidoreductase|uniref:Predicted oxidoreductase n=1 Tax=Halohasta litchfieldiae TaxID=1073996 RepID=A0A1H6S9L2_9EURY|nr:aldo/keto reductase [Halohasta litchfieldiae]ATW87902.1 aryl-alcohol dehydrogenase-like predicted oxidoreductase [Halohasta litchfieldiae]SEI62604.1 Predicted oxidoreductase [Halohasta litchfieldiae]